MTRQALILVLSAAAAVAQSYTYDSAGRLIRVAWPNGQGMEYTYDAADNLLRARPLVLPPSPSTVSARQTNASTNTLSWSAEGVAPSNWVLQRRAAGGDWQTIATLPGSTTTFADSNPSGLAYEYRVAASTGGQNSAWSRVFEPSTPASVELRVPDWSFATLRTAGTSPQTRGGYVTVDVDSGSIPYGSATFTLHQNGATVSTTSVPASPPTTRGRIFIEQRSGVTSPSGQFTGSVNVSTGIGLANLNQSAVELDLTLRDRNGVIVVSSKGALDGRAHTALLLSDLQTIAPGFQVPPSFATNSGYGSLDVVSSLPISIMALRATTNQRGEILFTSTPVGDLNEDPAAGSVIFPHFADGGGFNTAVALLNTAAVALTGNIEFIRSDGVLELSTRYSMGPGGAFLYETLGSGATRSGWIRLTPDPGQQSPLGAGIFRLALNGIVVSESGVPSSALSNNMILYIDRTAGRDTGAALANPSASQVTVTVRLMIPGGPTKVLLLPARGHTASASADLIAALPDGFTGVVQVQSTAPIAALSLRFQVNERQDLIMSTLPVADLTRAAPYPVIFPHIADGGGFQTELLLLGPINAAVTKASLFDDNGAPLPVAIVP